MQEKAMVNDILESTKSELTTYQNVISEAENIQLRQTVQQLRNNCESFQYELFKMSFSLSVQEKIIICLSGYSSAKYFKTFSNLSLS